jgi:hypothetical protein
LTIAIVWQLIEELLAGAHSNERLYWSDDWGESVIFLTPEMYQLLKINSCIPDHDDPRGYYEKLFLNGK